MKEHTRPESVNSREKSVSRSRTFAFHIIRHLFLRACQTPSKLYCCVHATSKTHHSGKTQLRLPNSETPGIDRLPQKAHACAFYCSQPSCTSRHAVSQPNLGNTALGTNKIETVDVRPLLLLQSSSIKSILHRKGGLAIYVSLLRTMREPMTPSVSCQREKKKKKRPVTFCSLTCCTILQEAITGKKGRSLYCNVCRELRATRVGETRSKSSLRQDRIRVVLVCNETR